MIYFIVPILTLLLFFLSALACLRHMLTRMGIYWVIPLIISLMLFSENLLLLVSSAAAADLPSFSLSTVSPLILAILWFCMVKSFSFALKTEREYNRYVDQSRRVWNEAAFVLKVEGLRTRKERKEKHSESANKPRVPSLPQYRFPDRAD